MPKWPGVLCRHNHYFLYRSLQSTVLDNRLTHILVVIIMSQYNEVHLSVTPRLGGGVVFLFRLRDTDSVLSCKSGDSYFQEER